MVTVAAVCLLVALVAALLGFTTVAGASFIVAKALAGIFFFVFLVLVMSGLFATRAA